MKSVFRNRAAESAFPRNSCGRGLQKTSSRPHFARGPRFPHEAARATASRFPRPPHPLCDMKRDFRNRAAESAFPRNAFGGRAQKTPSRACSACIQRLTGHSLPVHAAVRCPARRASPPQSSPPHPLYDIKSDSRNRGAGFAVPRNWFGWGLRKTPSRAHVRRATKKNPPTGRTHQPCPSPSLRHEK
jgi:hypothetical protein